MNILLPDGWDRPAGYSHGLAVRGEMIFVSGQVGWDHTQTFRTDSIVGQIGQALENTVDVLSAGGAVPANIVRMNWYFTDLREYELQLAEIGSIYRSVIGKHYPAMTVLEVGRLVADEAKVEIEATAVIPG